MSQSLRVFLCYASEDKPTVQALHNDLLAEKFNVWLDKENLLPNQNWDLEIHKAVKSADVIVVCLSNKSVIKKEYVQKEIKFALDIAPERLNENNFIILARLDNCNVPDQLSPYHCVDLFEQNGYHHLIKSLESRARQIESLKVSKKVRKFDKQTLTTIIVAVIGALATILAAVLPGYFQNKNNPSFTATPMIIVVSATPLPATEVSPVVSTFTSVPSTATSALALTSTPTVQPSPTTIVSPEMILIPAGEFTMGKDVTPKENQNVKPAHEVELNAYYIDKFEVTNGAYALCEKAGVCKAPYSLNSSARKNGYYSNPDYANFPVIYVDWFMAKTYCEWRGARLPSEAEWEKAARGTNDKFFPWGQNVISCAFAEYGACGRDTAIVGSDPNGISPYGVYDMAGNVWEWVADWYGSDYYQLSPDENPHGPFSGVYRVARGGGWNSESEQLHVTYRNRFRPDYNSFNLGFRCAKSP